MNEATDPKSMADKSIQDQIKENLKSMSLGDHLDELRARLILILLGIVIGLAITLAFGSRLVAFLEIPYHYAMQSAARSAEKDKEQTPPADIPPENLVVVHIAEQNRGALSSLKPGDSFLARIDYYCDDPNHPAFAAVKAVGGETEKSDQQPVSGKSLQTIQLSEGLLVYLKVCLVFGFILVSPWVFWQAWVFISAGLYSHERKFVHVVAPISAILFMAGSVFFIAVVAPLAMTFFIKFNRAMGVESNWTLQSYMSFVLMLTLVFGAAFQMPIGIVFAEMMGLVSIEMLTKNRKYVILGLLFISAVVTPPDVISQVLLATPLYVLYEGSIVVCRILQKRKKQSNEA
jgi:sec-independent protein translocase protein TatC